jgi:hypothetical protein
LPTQPRPTYLTSSQIVDNSSDGTYILEGDNTDVFFRNATSTTIVTTGHSQGVTLSGISNTITDNGHGTSISLDDSTLLTTIRNLQSDPTAMVHVPASDYVSYEQMARSMTVSEGFGTTFGPGFKGPEVLIIPGDTNVNIDQFQLGNEPALPNITQSDQAEIFRLYQAAFNRSPETDGYNYWVHQLDQGKPLQSISQLFTTSAEFLSDYGGLSVNDFVEKLYENILGRQGEPAGVKAWTDALNNGWSQGTVLMGFSESAENVALTAPLTHNH